MWHCNGWEDGVGWDELWVGLALGRGIEICINWSKPGIGMDKVNGII